MKRIGIGIIGAGHMGRVHARVLSRDERVRIVGVCDEVNEKAELLAKQYNAKAYLDYQDLIEDPDIDAVYVTTPNAHHVKPVLCAIEHGKHIFSEKPMSTSLKSSKRILEAVKRSNVKYQVGHNRRFCPVYKKAKELITRRKVIPYIADVKIVRGELQKPSWVGDLKISGGLLYESVIHILDLLRWLMGEVIEVNCLAKANVYTNHPNDFVISLKFKDNRIASITASGHATWIFPFERVEIYGDHSCLITEEMSKIRYSPGLKREIRTWDFSKLPIEKAWGYEEEDKLFIDALLGKEKIPVDVREGYKAVELVEACYRSARTGKSVELPINDF